MQLTIDTINIFAIILHLFIMKPKHLFLIVLIFFTSCSKNIDSLYPNFDEYGIGYFNDADFMVDCYDTYIGKYYTSVKPILKLKHPHQIKWYIHTSSGDDFEFDNITLVDDSRLNTPDFTVEYFAKPGDTIKAVILASTGPVKKIERVGVVVENNNYQSHIFGLKFGMSIEEVQKREREKFGAQFKFVNDYTPESGLYVIFRSYYLKNQENLTATMYKFSDDKLVQIGEFIYEPHAYSPSLIDFCVQLGADRQAIKTSGLGFFDDYSWNNDNLDFMLTEEPIIYGYDMYSKGTFAGVFFKLKEQE